MEGGLAVAGVALAIPGIIDLCIKYGLFLKEKYDLYKSMDADMKLYDLIRNLVEGEMHDVLMFFTSIDSKLSDDLHGQIESLLLQLKAELIGLRALVTAKPAAFFEKVKYSLRQAKEFRKRFTSLEEWHVRFLRRATVLVLFGNFSPNIKDKTVEEAAARAVRRIKRIREAVTGADPEELYHGELPEEARLESFTNSTAVVLKNPGSPDSIIEFRPYGTSSDAKNATRYIVQELASKMAGADPSTMGILRSLGFYDDTGAHRNRFVLQFEIPKGKTNPKTLQDLLADDKNQKDLVHSLSDRVTLAKKIASGLLFVHAGGFVHKKVNPTNIFVFETENGAYPSHIGEPYLTGFDLVRKADQASARLATEDWKENIYLHPDRHRLQEGDEFTMLHDIYSLGVVLLEIAYWSSFTDLRGIGKYLLAKEDKSQLLGPDDLKRQYIRLAEKHIPPRLGSNYSELVKSCLEGLPNGDGPPHVKTAVAVGSSYMEQVMGQLEQINL
jgi:hypothetical protein